MPSEAQRFPDLSSQGPSLGSKLRGRLEAVRPHGVQGRRRPVDHLRRDRYRTALSVTANHAMPSNGSRSTAFTPYGTSCSKKGRSPAEETRTFSTEKSLSVF